LLQLVSERKFRADLYFRLNVFPMTLPPLRERYGDIRLLAVHFVQKFAKQQGKVIDTIPEDVILALEHHDWPGNIRELQNVIERGVIMTTGSTLTREVTAHLSPRQVSDIRVVATVGSAGIKTLAEVERAHITAMLHETKWVIGGPRGAASLLGLPRTTLISKMQRLGIPGRTPRGRQGRPESFRVLHAVAV